MACLLRFHLFPCPLYPLRELDHLFFNLGIFLCVLSVPSVFSVRTQLFSFKRPTNLKVSVPRRYAELKFGVPKKLFSKARPSQKESDRLGNIDARLLGLRVLDFSRYSIEFSVFDEPGAGLPKSERNAAVHTLFSNIQYPLVPANPRFRTGLSSHDDAFDRFIQIPSHVNRRKQWFVSDHLVLNRKLFQNRKASVRRLLVFARDADAHVIVPFSPIVREVDHEALDPFREKQKPTIPPLSYHPPSLETPLVTLIQQEVGGEARPKECPGRTEIRPVLSFSYRQIEGFVFRRRIGNSFVLRIHPVHITVEATRADLLTPVPRVPQAFIHFFGFTEQKCCVFDRIVHHKLLIYPDTRPDALTVVVLAFDHLRHNVR